MNTKTAIERVNEASVNPLGEIRVCDNLKEGQAIRQGDLYLVYSPNESKGERLKQTQLAPGNTQGSRHTVDSSVAVYAHPKQNQVITTSNGKFVQGPVIESSDRFSLLHPEHADHSLPAGRYTTRYQYDPRFDKRVVD